MWCMARTNIDIDEELIRNVMDRYGFPTKREAVHVALRNLVPTPMSRDEALSMRGSGWEGDLDSLRSGFGVDKR